MFELFLDLAVPGGLGVEAEIAKGGFHIRSGMGLASGVPCGCAEGLRGLNASLLGEDCDAVCWIILCPSLVC